MTPDMRKDWKFAQKSWLQGGSNPTNCLNMGAEHAQGLTDCTDPLATGRLKTHWSSNSLLEADALDFLVALRQLLPQVGVSRVDLRRPLVVYERLLHPAQAHISVRPPVDALQHRASTSSRVTA